MLNAHLTVICEHMWILMVTARKSSYYCYYWRAVAVREHVTGNSSGCCSTHTCTARTRWNTILICSFCGVQFYWYVVDMLGTLCRSRCLAHCCCECARRKKAMQCGCVRAHTLRNYHIKTANVAIYKFKQIRLCLSVSRMLDARRSRAPRVNFQTINSIGLEHTGHMGISLLWYHRYLFVYGQMGLLMGSWAHLLESLLRKKTTSGIADQCKYCAIIWNVQTACGCGEYTFD